MAYAPSDSILRGGFFDRTAMRIANAGRGFKQALTYQRTVRELNRLTDLELTDIGLSRGSIPEMARKAVYGV